MSDWVWVSLGASLVLGAVIVFLMIRIRRMTRPDRFQRRPTTESHGFREVLPESFNAFQQKVAPAFVPDRPNAWQVDYRGVGGDVSLQAVRAGSQRGAVRVLRGIRRGRTRNVFVASRLGGDHSYVVHHGGPKRTIAWTNDRWAFVARSSDYLALEEFVNNYPY